MTNEIQWSNQTITEPGVYVDIPLEVYHNKTDLLDAPSVSKSSLKNVFRCMGGSPKQFWNLWSQNPNRVEQKPTDSLNLGKAVHCLFLDDEVFAEAFEVRPVEFKDYRPKAAQEWKKSVYAAGKTPVTIEEVEQIKRMAEDAAQNDLVQQGILNGAVERSLLFKDKTGIWFRSRPDNMAFDGFWSDLKTTSSMDPSFIRKQAFACGYFLQAAGVRMACRELGLPFETFAAVYVCSGETPDTQVIEFELADLDLGEQMIRSGLDTISACLKSGNWPGAQPFEGRTLSISDRNRDAIKAELQAPRLELEEAA